MKNILIILLFLFACQHKEAKPKLIVENFKYAAYGWKLNYDFNDSCKFNKFYLAFYLEIDKNGHFNVMRHDTFMDTPKYFAGNIPDTLVKTINEVFTNDNFKTEYFYDKNAGVLYCGFTYCIDYKKKDSTAKKIEFVQSQTPAAIQNLCVLLDSLVYTYSKNKIDSLNIEKYSKELEVFSLRNHPLLPQPKKLPPIIKLKINKFKPVKIKAK